MLRKAITERVKEAKVKLKINKQYTLFITDVDPSVTEEVEEVLVKEFGPVGEGSARRVLSLRSNAYGRYIATIRSTRSEMKNLVVKGKIKIRSLYWRIRERITITRCYKFLEFGHSTSECEGADRKQEYLRCGEKDTEHLNAKVKNYAQRVEWRATERTLQSTQTIGK